MSREEQRGSVHSDRVKMSSFDEVFITAIENFREVGNYVNNSVDEIEKVLENYCNQLKEKTVHQNFSGSGPTLSKKKNSSKKKVKKNNNENLVTSTNGTGRSRRTTKPSTVTSFECTLRDHENNNVPMADVTNVPMAVVTNVPMTAVSKDMELSGSNRTRTKVLNKCNQPEVLHLPAASGSNCSAVSENCLPIHNDAGENQPIRTSEPAHSTPARTTPSTEPAHTTPSCSVPTSPGPPSIVKLRTRQFEDLANNEKGASVKKNNKENGETLPNSHEVNQSAAQKNLNNTFTVPASTNVGNRQNDKLSADVDNQQVTRVTRAMAQIRRNLESSTDSSSSCKSNSSQTGKVARGKVVKRSLVKINCKKSIRSARLMEKAKKKEELTKKTQANTKNHNERRKKVLAAHEAKLREQLENDQAMIKKKEEKMKAAAAERERILKEEIKKNALAAHQKKLEAQERRKQDEAARQARLREIEEDRKRTEAALKKKKEGAEAIRQKKNCLKSPVVLLNAMKPEKENPVEKENPRTPEPTNKTVVVAANVTHTVVTDDNNYEMTPDRDNRILKSPKTAEDYGIDDIASGDSSEDEDHPKKKIPVWAQRQNLRQKATVSSYVPLAVWNHMYKCDCNPQLSKLLGIDSKRPRTSSAQWTATP